MQLPTLYLPVDLTGVAPANKRVKEEHTIASRSTRVLKPNFGLYYTESFQIWSVAGTGPSAVRTLLTHKVDYSFVEFFERLTRITGKEVCGAVLIHRQDLPDAFEITYQALGGKENIDHEQMAAAVAALSRSGETIDWDDILDKPTQFPPAPHLHDSADVYGLEYLVKSIRDLIYAITVGADASMKRLLVEALKSRATVVGSLQAFWDALESHFLNRTNSHNVTKGQVGLASMENRHFVRKTVNGVSIEPYASPKTTFNIIKAALLGDIMKHIDDKRNPHEVTALQIQMELVPNFPMGTADLIIAGTDQASFVSPAMVFEALPALVGGILLHIEKTNNPHNVTKGQVGLGLVNNFAVAVSTEMQLGTTEERYVTPENIKELVDAYATNGSGLATHLLAENPHAEDQASVGLDQLSNFGTATESDARFGYADDLFLTPKVMRDAIYNGYAAKLDNSAIDAPMGVAPLGADRRVPARLLGNTPDYREFSLKAFFLGTPATDQMLAQRVFTRAVTFPADFAGSLVACRVPSPARPVTIEILKGEDTVLAQVIFYGTADVGAASTSGVIMSNNTPINFAAGEVMSFRCTVSDVIQDIAIHLKGTYDLAASSNPMGGLIPRQTVRTAGRVIFGGGLDASNAMVSSRDVYRISNSAITTTTGLTNAKNQAAAFGNSMRGYLAGGKNGTGAAAADLERHQYSDLTVSTFNALAVARWGGIGLGNENIGMVIGGITAADALTNATTRYRYASNTLSTVASLGLTLSRSPGYSSAQYGYIRNGSSIFLEFNGSTYFGKYNYAGETLSVITTASTLSRYGHSSAGNRTVGLTVGGYYQGAPLTNVQRHLYATDALSVGTALGDARAFGAGGGDDTKGVFAGGLRSSGTVVDTATLYTYADDTTSTGTALSAARQNFNALSTSPGWR